MFEVHWYSWDSDLGAAVPDPNAVEIRHVDEAVCEDEAERLQDEADDGGYRHRTKAYRFVVVAV